MPRGACRVSEGLPHGAREDTRRGTTSETRGDRGDGDVVHKGSGILLVYVDIDARHDQEFNTWYTTEHLPELLAVPGILAAARYVAVKGGPKYLAFYELEDIDVLHTPAFTTRPRTPWGASITSSRRPQHCMISCYGSVAPVYKICADRVLHSLGRVGSNILTIRGGWRKGADMRSLAPALGSGACRVRVNPLVFPALRARRLLWGGGHRAFPGVLLALNHRQSPC